MQNYEIAVIIKEYLILITIKRNFYYIHSQQKISTRKLVYQATSQTNLARENLWKAEQLKNKSFVDAVCKASKISERMIKRTIPH